MNTQWLDALPSPNSWSVDDGEAAFDAYFEHLHELLGPDLAGYRNHCIRVFANVRALAPELDLEPVVPALVFHDIGLWSHRTIDYLEPSAELARTHLNAIGRDDWLEPVEAMIVWHHKLRVYRGAHASYVEPVRRADLADVSFGLQGGVPREVTRAGRARYPNEGFHRMLLRRWVGRLATRPWSPLPMMRF